MSTSKVDGVAPPLPEALREQGEAAMEWLRMLARGTNGPMPAHHATVLLTELRRLSTDLAEAAREINCAGPVAHRIRVLKSELEAAAQQERARLAEVLKHARALTTAFLHDDETDIGYSAFRDLVENLDAAVVSHPPPTPEAVFKQTVTPSCAAHIEEMRKPMPPPTPEDR